MYGKTDEYGFEGGEDKVHVHDLHATMLHLLGLDHERLTYRSAGRDMRLTDVKGKVVTAIMSRAFRPEIPSGIGIVQIVFNLRSEIP